MSSEKLQYFLLYPLKNYLLRCLSVGHMAHPGVKGLICNIFIFSDTHGGNEVKSIQTGRALTADGFIMSSSTSSYDDLDFEAHEQKREGFSRKGSSSSDSSIAFDNAEMEKGEIDQTKEGLLNTETTLFLTISYLIGSALINTPSIMRYVGWSGVGVIVFIAIISAYTTIIILREFVAARNNYSGSFLSYVTLCEKRNVYWSIFITILFLLYLVLMLITTLHDIVNIVFHTTKFHEKIEDLKVTRVNEHRAGVASMGTVLFPLTLMRSPKKYSWLVYICTLLCTIVALLLTTSLGNLQRSRPETDNSNATNEVQITVHTLAIACNLIRFFGIHAILSLIISDMKDPKEAPRIIATGFAVPTIIVVIVSMMSYYTFGERITPILFEVIDMAVAKNSTFFLTISITVIKSLLCFQLCFVYILTFNTFNLFLEHIGLSTGNYSNFQINRLIFY